MRADGFLLRELQFAQGAVPNVVVRDVSARVVQKPADAVLWHAGRSTFAGIGAPQCMVCRHAELGKAVAAYMSAEWDEPAAAVGPLPHEYPCQGLCAHPLVQSGGSIAPSQPRAAGAQNIEKGEHSTA